MTTLTARSHRRPRTVLYALGTVATLTIAACGSGGSETVQLSQGSSGLAASADDLAISPPDTPAIDLEFVTFDGNTRSTSEYLGRPLVINFFAAWCPPCVAEMPDFETVFNDVGGEVGFLGISQDADPSDALDLVARTGVSYDIGWDPDLEVYRFFGGFAMPTTVFIDADGQVAEVFSGALTADALREKIDAIGT